MKALRSLWLVGMLEGISFVVLLGIAMPLKYFMDLPLAVRVVGPIHGVLFLWFMALLFRVQGERGWKLSASALLVLLSLLPFGFWLIDRKLKAELEAAAQSEASAIGS